MIEAIIEKIISEKLGKLGDDSLQDVILDESANFIEENSKDYVNSAVCALKEDDIQLRYNFSEILDLEYPILKKVNLENEMIFIEVELGYLLNLWNDSDCVGQVTATARGKYSFRLKKFLDNNSNLVLINKVKVENLSSLKPVIEEFKIIELKNIEEYFDDYSVL